LSGPGSPPLPIPAPPIWFPAGTRAWGSCRDRDPGRDCNFPGPGPSRGTHRGGAGMGSGGKPGPYLSYPILSYSVLAHSILPHPILSCPVLSYPIQSYPIVSCSVISRPVGLWARGPVGPWGRGLVGPWGQPAKLPPSQPKQAVSQDNTSMHSKNK